jgi:hypothetical protein
MISQLWLQFGNIPALFPIFFSGANTIVKDSGNIIDDTVRFMGFNLNNDSLISYVTALASSLVVSILVLSSGILRLCGK